MTGPIYIVIPSLDPDEKLLNTIAGLKEVGFKHFIIVDDGSREENLKYFPQAEDGTIILHHPTNKGKGAALKTAFRHIIYNCQDAAGVITVDGDGQHLPEDVLACADMLQENQDIAILGCRDFSGDDVPTRSRFGNRSTSLVFKLLCGMNISDTQTGLRAFPAQLLPSLLEIQGERFEYETNMLLKFHQAGVAIQEVKINTVYIEENATSHFHAIKDSLRIYRFILAFFASSVISFVADISLFYIICKFFGYTLGGWAEVTATFMARAVSSFINYSINRKHVFGDSSSRRKTVLKYYAVAIPQMLISGGVVSALVAMLGTQAELSTVIKIVVDTALFLISYRIQHAWVFSGQNDENCLWEQTKAQKTENTKLTTGKIIKRSLLSVATALLMAIVTVISACLVICYGPSKSLRNMLVISAKQASATKWIPGIFLSGETVEQIMAESRKVNTDTIDFDDYSATDSTDEWNDAIDGMRLIFINEPRYKAYLLLVKDPSRVIVGVSSENFKSATAGMRIFDLVEKYNATAAINAGEFADVGGQGNGATPMGLTYSQAKAVWTDSLRRTFIGFDAENRLICRESMTSAEADALKIRDAVSFQNGNVLIEQIDNEIKLHYSDSNTGTAQRTAIGQRADGTVIMLVTDGRCADSIGATRNDVIDIMVKYGAVTAGMLDGGSSAMMCYPGYYNKYTVDMNQLDVYQQKGLVNRYKAFTNPRRMPTYFIVTGE